VDVEAHSQGRGRAGTEREADAVNWESLLLSRRLPSPRAKNALLGLAHIHPRLEESKKIKDAVEDGGTHNMKGQYPPARSATRR